MSEERWYYHKIRLLFANGKRGWIQGSYVDGGPPCRYPGAPPHPLPDRIEAHGLEGRSYMDRPERRPFRKTGRVDEEGAYVYEEIVDGAAP